ncbi:Rossmann-fold NAD(P)-binding domain-containing protein [Streptomyces litchfieldiae]|uniref:NmrA family NAD(P)-binding protein n=1 Tax=Streptomyces litchfieldiae TaxID=3075543 RepID=A0ABU2MWC0_9ACTN|nr:NmrA family NAD(P)-binding protein [Streptomyces sp. DSM 44938]MDT0345950.1 NmrA family NAD(P)-binding protein [Streptomyces sp. DSM 44938]
MILVTGVSGALGGLIHDGLTAFDDLTVVAGTRAGDGTTARRIDFDDPTTLATGLAGVSVLVFVSAGYAEDDVVLARHGAVVAAAAAAGVRHVIYTSLAGSGELMTIALPHRWTETRLAAAPFDVTILRNGLYADVPVGLAAAGAASAAATGVFAAAFGTGRVSVVAKQDLADVAVRVAAESARDLAAGRRGRHAGRTYELEGVTAIGGEDIAELLTGALGRTVAYRPVSLAETREALRDSGLEPYQITHALSLFSNVNAGLLQATDTDLTTLLPAAPRPVRHLVADAVAAGGYQSQSIGTISRGS